MRYIFPLLVSYGIGHLLLSNLLSKTKNINCSLFIFLASGLGLGISSQIMFYNLFVFDQLNKTPVLWGNLLILFILIMLRFSSKSKQKQDPKTTNYLFSTKNLLIFIVIGIAFIPLVFQAYFYPWGGWDAWSAWNLKARFLFWGNENWKNLLDPILWRSSPHYPLFLSLINVWGWVLYSTPEPIVPLLTALVFSLLTVGLLFAALNTEILHTSSKSDNTNKKELVNKTSTTDFPPSQNLTNLSSMTNAELSNISTLPSSYLALTATLLILTLPFFTKLATSQYCDIVLSYYLLATIVCSIISRVQKLKPFALLAGLFLGFLSFTKSEGTTAALIIFILNLPYLFLREEPLKKQRLLITFFLGVLMGILPTILFQFFLAPANQTFINGLTSTIKPSNILRIKMIVAFVLVELKSSKWHGLWLLFFVGLLLSKGKCFRPEIRIIPIFLFFYLLMISCYYYVNTYFEIGWWLQVSLNRILFAILPCVVFWVFDSLRGTNFRKFPKG